MIWSRTHDNHQNAFNSDYLIVTRVQSNNKIDYSEPLERKNIVHVVLSKFHLGIQISIADLQECLRGGRSIRFVAKRVP